MKNIQLVILIVSFLFTFNKVAEDLVPKIEGFPYTDSDIYSGYIDLSPVQLDVKIHYLLVESQSDPAKDPLLIWLNGGPGCSSLLGFASENGPVIIDDDDPSKNRKNEFSWNKKANVLYIEAPAGVGFSYSKSTANPEYNDDKTADHNLQALKIFLFNNFKEYATRDLYISGESYAGIYIPTLAKRILDYNADPTTPPQFKIVLKGLLIGNGITDWKIEADSSMHDMLYNHSFISVELREEYVKKCKKYPWSYQTDDCQNTKDYIMNQIGPVFLYNTIIDCYTPAENRGIHLKEETLKSNYKSVYRRTPWLKNRINMSNLKEDFDCYEGPGVENFFNRNDVKKALHVETSITWGGCSPINYFMADIGTLYIYPQLINSHLKIWLYSGDVDAIVPTNGTLEWTNKLGMNISNDWRPWRLTNDYISGFVIDYEGLSLVTVRGTGHMVPQWKREEALHLVNSFLYNTDL